MYRSKNQQVRRQRSKCWIKILWIEFDEGGLKTESKILSVMGEIWIDCCQVEVLFETQLSEIYIKLNQAMCTRPLQTQSFSHTNFSTLFPIKQVKNIRRFNALFQINLRQIKLHNKTQITKIKPFFFVGKKICQNKRQRRDKRKRIRLNYSLSLISSSWVPDFNTTSSCDRRLSCFQELNSW